MRVLVLVCLLHFISSAFAFLLFLPFSTLLLRHINPITGSQTPTQPGPQGQVGSIGLERAFKLLQPLTMLPGPQCEGNVEVWIAFYDVTARRGE